MAAHPPPRGRRRLGHLAALVERADTIERRPPVHLPEASALELEQAMPPREAFFAPVEHVPAERAAGRIAAEMISPYPPCVPVLAPGEVVTDEVLDYLRSGDDHGVPHPVRYRRRCNSCAGR